MTEQVQQAPSTQASAQLLALRNRLVELTAQYFDAKAQLESCESQIRDIRNHLAGAEMGAKLSQVSTPTS